MYFILWPKIQQILGSTKGPPFSVYKREGYVYMNFLASRCAEQFCHAHREMTIGSCVMFLTARYPTFGDMRAHHLEDLCAVGD